MAPNELTTGTDIGARKTCTSTRVMIGSRI
jgi:hypothetical protein